MESFINALARAQDPSWSQVQTLPTTDIPQLKISERVLALSPDKLKANRIVSFDGSDGITRTFDVLRNTCTRDLSPRVVDRPILGVTSPSIGCGASTTAINLAFSLARQQKGAVMLADLTPAGQGWWRQLGIDQMDLSPSALRDTVMTLEVGDTSLRVASLRPVVDGKSGDELKLALRNWAAGARRDLGPVTIVLDLPPLLTDDRVGSFISELDLALLVLATGKSTKAELETCKSYLHDAASVQLVLNKARDYDL
ncbi:MAG: hypothetical protein P0Y65_16200 [Candidatus Devosia phytovorans]|uniref:Exopolysaccharide biosynthesis protein n=1 Tax=Candidatus Devosia phytovorans TaxID=3121372 RepID=A0AAJ5VS51_9HYPH|nr:hypothetical protein [Devosia sp.]WEK03719.1 MAG: hypothetical protein P0Y65_16200 [Devosia sp.]